MLNTFSSWLFNVLLWGGIIGFAILFYHTFVSPILYDGLVALIALAIVLVLSLFWPKL